MKSNFKFVAVLLFILLNALFAFGQKRKITSGEYFSAHSAALQKEQSVARRVETLTERYSGGNTEKKTTTVFESLSPDRYRRLIREQLGDSVTENESIRLGNFLYERKTDDAWTKVGVTDSEIPKKSGANCADCYSQQMTVEQTFLNNVSVYLYEVFYIHRNDTGSTYIVEKKWISEEGLPLKTETSVRHLETKIERLKTVTTYEYNPTDLKVEAPIEAPIK